MAKAPKYGLVIQYDKTYKGTSIGRRPITSTMNKNKLLGKEEHETRSKYKKTSIGRRPSTSMLNKKKRQGRNKKQMKYRGQGK